MYTSITGFMYGNVYDDEERFERQAVFPKLLAKYANDFSWVSPQSLWFSAHNVYLDCLSFVS